MISTKRDSRLIVNLVHTPITSLDKTVAYNTVWIKNTPKEFVMASHQPKDVNGFVGQREQARYPTATLPQPGPHGSPQYLPLYASTQASQQQSLEVSSGTDLASRRQKTKSNRRDIGEKLRVVRPPTLSNPDELPLRKRSAMTLIEKAQEATQAAAGEDILALASKISSFQPFTKVRFKLASDYHY
jgi:hypothetical protein